MTSTSALTAHQLDHYASESDALITMLSDQMDENFLKRNQHLKVIANFAVGFNNIDLKAANSYGIRVGNTPGVLTNATADLALTLLMATSRNLIAAHNNVINHQWKQWEPQGFLGVELKGKTLGIFGAGRIGKAFAHKCFNALGMKIIYHSQTVKPQFEKEYHAKYVDFPTLLSESDVLSLHAPLTDKTDGMMGEKQFAMMKDSAIFINTARGQMHDEQALLNAINGKKLFAAGLDVTTIEPLPADFPLRGHPKILILPHIGSATLETREQMAKLCADNVQSAFTGQPMPAEVKII
jgi:lactate dehydrogenase-like 2-hydroxyacid dehydrogenase